jgi:hypothetical protein
LQTPRFDALYSRWLRQGDAVFEGPSSSIIAEALGDGRGRVEALVLPHSYRHLSPLVDQPHSIPDDSLTDARRRQEFHSHKTSKSEARRERIPALCEVTADANVAGDEGLRREPKGEPTGPHALNPGPQPPSDDSTLTISEQLDRDWHRMNEWYNSKNLCELRHEPRG